MTKKIEDDLLYQLLVNGTATVEDQQNAAKWLKQYFDEAQPLYLVWSHEHRAWWAPDHCGYVQDVAKAGRYPRLEALGICFHAGWGFNKVPNEVPVRESDVLALDAMKAGR